MTDSLAHYTCCFTGHRAIPEEHLGALIPLLDRTVCSLFQSGVRVFRTGGALGFDTVAALTVLKYRSLHPELRLELCLPCRDQQASWSHSSRQVYADIIARADKVTYLHEQYTQGCMLERNRFMVDGSDICVGYCTSDKGGSAYTLRYAEKQGLRVINLAALLRNKERI